LKRGHISQREARLETRVVLSVLIAIILLLAVAAFGYFSGAWEAP